MGKKENLKMKKEAGRREKKVGHIVWFLYSGCPNVEKHGSWHHGSYLNEVSTAFFPRKRSEGGEQNFA